MKQLFAIVFAMVCCGGSAAEWPVLKTYEGEFLRRVKMPLGGIGTGTISLAGRGALVDWEIRNSPDKGFTPEVNDVSTGFWIRTEDAEGRVTARLLEGPLDTECYEGGEGCKAPNHAFPRFRDCMFKVAYPLAQVALADPDVPVKPTLEAMNPLVPGDADASGIPAALLRWRIENPGAKPVKVSILAFLVNAAGGECRKSPTEVFGFGEQGEHILSQIGVEIGSADETPVDTTLGRVKIVVPASVGAVSRATAIADDGWMVRLDRFWKRFVATGKAYDNAVPEDPHQVPAVAMAVNFMLAPGETKRVPFALGWCFPHRYGWTYNGYRSEIVRGPFAAENDIGNYYSTPWNGPCTEGATLLLNELDAFEQKTVDFVNGVCASRAPDVVKEAALFNLSTLRSEVCFRTKNRNFFGWEGIFEKGGSCFGSCTHVWGYEHALIDLWPELAKNMTELQFGPQMKDTGEMSFRVGLPLCVNAQAVHPAADGQMQCIIKAYENWTKTKDDAWMKKLYSRIKRAMEFCWSKDGTWNWDADKDGVMEGRQHNTMDVDYHGPNPQMEFLYLAALKAMAAMADAADDADFAAECRGLFAKGSAWTEANLFNGSYYEHKVSGEHDYQLAKGCLIDQLLGDYASRHVGLGPVADETHAKTALATILAKNASANVGPRYNCGRDYAFPDEPSLKMAWYPEGTMPEKPFPYYGENMTGFEYVVAANLAQRGEFAAAEKVVRDIRSRYDGRKRNPFDEAECGHHYVRALAAWSVLKAWEARP